MSITRGADRSTNFFNRPTGCHLAGALSFIQPASAHSHRRTNRLAAIVTRVVALGPRARQRRTSSLLGFSTLAHCGPESWGPSAMEGKIWVSNRTPKISNADIASTVAHPRDSTAAERHYRFAEAAKILRTYSLNSGLAKNSGCDAEQGDARAIATTWKIDGPISGRPRALAKKIAVLRGEGPLLKVWVLS